MSTPLPGLPARVEVCEAGPRDGPQNERVVVPVEVKAQFVRRLLAAGLTTVERWLALDLPALVRTSAWMAEQLGRPSASRTASALAPALLEPSCSTPA